MSPKDSFHIRLAVAADIQSVAEIHVASWRTTYVGIVPQSVLDELSVDRRKMMWSQAILQPAPSTGVWVAEDRDGQVVGFANYGPERQGGRAYAGEVYAIYLLHSVQRRGLGRSLMQACAMGFRDLGMDSMLVWVLADNPACRFYERVGGRVIQETSIHLGGVELREVAYGWRDLSLVLNPAPG